LTVIYHIVTKQILMSNVFNLVKTRAWLPAHLSHLNLKCYKQHDLYIYFFGGF